VSRIRSHGPTTASIKLGSQYVNVVGQGWTPVTDAMQPLQQYDYCADDVHVPPYRVGGPLTIRKIRDEHSGTFISQAQTVAGFTDRYYTGLVVPNVSFGVAAVPSDYTGSEYGAEAWNKARPGKPGVDLAQAIAELKDLPGMVKSLRNMFGRAVNSFGDGVKRGADGYLTYMFAVAPLISDLKKLHNTYSNQELMLAQIRRDNGKGIRRRLKLCSTSRSTTATYGFDVGTNPQLVKVGEPRCTEIIESSKDVWFSGRFRYYIPDIGSVAWRNRALRALYGTNPSIRLIWELTPWSWLVDYFINVGDALGNLQNDLAENLMADYAFLMAHVRTTRTVRWDGRVRMLNGSTQGLMCSRKRVIETKSRSIASPFGFGLNVDGLSDRQASILAALGVSRTWR